MEYEKHIKRLILGYLKTECKYTYKVFLKYNFNNQHKHIPTRVGGQTLEDILRIYSRIQEIVQGRLEETNYYKEKSPEFLSPFHLDNQLLYLLDKYKQSTPCSTPCPRSPAESLVTEYRHEIDVLTSNISDVETTPEHSLPGNVFSHDDNYNNKTKYRKSGGTNIESPAEKSSNTEKDSVQKVSTSNSPEKNDFDKKLFNPTFDMSVAANKSQTKEASKNKDTSVTNELDYMLQNFLGTQVTNTRNCETATCTNSTSTYVTTPSRNWMNIDVQNSGAVSAILTANNNPVQAVSTSNEVLCNNSAPYSLPESSVQAVTQSTNFESNLYSVPTSTGIIIVPPSTSAVQPINQPQQFYIVNQPVVISNVNPAVKFIQPKINQPLAISTDTKNTIDNANIVHISEQDIMAMPTIILDEKNEITYADPGGLKSQINNNFMSNEVNNIKEFFNMYGATDKSPILKANLPRKGTNYKPLIKPAPTIKVEIFGNNGPFYNPSETKPNSTSSGKSKSKFIQSETIKTTSSGLPNLNETVDEAAEKHEEFENRDVYEETPNEPKLVSQEKTGVENVCSTVTPSPLCSVSRKQTPKSGSHVRNLTFPSPLRRTSEKPESNIKSPININKQQAVKDLFKSDNEEEKKTVDGNKMEASSDIIPESSQNKKSCQQDSSQTPKKKSKTLLPNSTKKTPKNKNNVQQETKSKILPNSWDANLRKLTTIQEEDTKVIPVKRTSTRRKNSSDGKKIEEALKTPDVKKPKAKCRSRKKTIVKTNNQESKEKKTPEEGTKGETKILSPSKLHANKRNLIPADDDVTPHNSKELSQYPILSKTRRNINDLLETPLKKDAIPPTPDIVLNKIDTPFTPMLKANLKDYTGGDIFSVNTPNFPVTPGLTELVGTSTAYYILSDNENNKATEASVLLEEKKSSVRKSDDEEFVLDTQEVYGSKKLLENFNRNCVGKKNLELLDNRGVQWDGGSDKEERSDDNSDGESNNTVIQSKKPENTEGSEVVRTGTKSMGKCMNSLNSNYLKSDIPDDNYTASADKSRNIENGAKKVPNDFKNCTSSSDSEVLTKIGQSKKTKVLEGSDFDLESKETKTCGKENKPDSICNSAYSVSTTEAIRQTIEEVQVDHTLGPSLLSLKEQLEGKKKRMIEFEKMRNPVESRKTPSRRATRKPNTTPQVKRRCSPRKTMQSERLEENSEKTADENSELVAKEVEGSTNSKTESFSDRVTYSQDEFFKKSGTNLHRTNKGSLEKTSRDNEKNTKSMDSKNVKESKDGKLNNQQKLDSDDVESKCVTHDESDDPDEFEKSWYYCEFRSYDSEDLRVEYDESQQIVAKKYDLDILKKKIELGVPCSDGTTEPVLLTVSPFDTLFDTNLNDHSDLTEHLRASFENSKPLTDPAATESRGYKSDDVDEFKCAKKRKHRSESSSSNPPSKKINTTEMLNKQNISRLLTHLHGPD